VDDIVFLLFHIDPEFAEVLVFFLKIHHAQHVEFYPGRIKSRLVIKKERHRRFKIFFHLFRTGFLDAGRKNNRENHERHKKKTDASHGRKIIKNGTGE